MGTMHFHITQTGSFLELYFAFRGRNKQFGTQAKLSWERKVSLIDPGLYCSLICIEPECLLT